MVSSLQVAVEQALRRSKRNADDLATYVLGLRGAGMTYRAIAAHLTDTTGVPVSYVTVMRWVESWEDVAA